ncbi:MAG TPA: extracellular solute-binding protein, partial [Devosia sp.]|nr:extracellular solute-binding protein [Devosia sp.]
PWIRVDYLDLNGPEAVQRYLLEKSAGSKTADFMVLSSPQAFYDLSSRGEIVDYQSPEIVNLPDGAVPYPGVYGIFVDADVFLWNKRLLPAELVPTGLADLAAKVAENPDVFNGKVTAYPPLTNADRRLAMRLFLDHHGDEMWTWLESIGPNVRFESSAGPMVQKILTGEYLMSMGLPLSVAMTHLQNPASASLLDWGYVTDATAVGLRMAAIPVGGSTPNSSRLLLDTILAPEGQAAIAKTFKIPMRSDIPTDGLPAGALTADDIVEAVGAENVIQADYDPAIEAGEEAFIERFKTAYKITE